MTPYFIFFGVCACGGVIDFRCHFYEGVEGMGVSGPSLNPFWVVVVCVGCGGREVILLRNRIDGRGCVCACVVKPSPPVTTPHHPFGENNLSLSNS